MPAIAASAIQTVPVGINHSNQFFVYATVGTALSSSDTLTVALPAEVPVDARPVAAVVYGPASSSVVTALTTLALTSHNVATGVTTLTASGSVAQYSHVVLTYLGAGTA